MPDESLLQQLDTDLSTGRAGTDIDRGVLHREKMRPVRDDWDEPKPENFNEEPTNMKRTTQKSMFKKMFIGACIFAIIAVGFFVFSLFTGRARLTGENVDMSVQAKTFADSGEELNVRVSITNKNSVAMELGKLTFSYPVGSTTDPNALKDISRDIGTIAPGETHDETYSIQLFGEQGAQKPLSAMVEYRLAGSNAVYEKTSDASLTLRSSIASLVVTAPDTILSGQELPFQLTISGNTTDVVKNAMLVGDFPDGCTLVSSDPVPTLDKNIWYLGDLPAGSQKQLSVSLSCTGVTNEEKNIVFTLGAQDEKDERKIASVYTGASHVVKLSSAFFATTLSINGKPVDTTTSIPQNQESTVDINWTNTTDTPITNTQVKIALSGAAFDPDKLHTFSGFFDNSANTVLWTSNELASLKTIQPGETGTMSFSLTPKSGLTTLSTLDMAVSVNAVGFGGTQESLVNSTIAKIPVVTDLQLLPQVLYHSGPFQNTGPMPIKVGQETTFTVVWKLANSTNAVSGVTVKTVLPTGINWKNNIAPASDASNISYNTITREITWNVTDVPVGQNAKSIAFQVSLTPVTNQKGTAPNLTNDISLVGTDTITKTLITQSKRGLTTRLNGDTSQVGADGMVK